MSSVVVVFLPMFQKHREQGGEERAWRFSSEIFNSLLLLVLSGIILVILGADYLVPLYVPGFSPEKQHLTAQLMRIMLFSPFFFTMSSFFISIENAFHRFATQALAPILYNLGILAGIWFFAPYYGVYGLAWGVVLGALAQMLIQIPAVYRLGFRWKPILISSRELKEFCSVLLPRVLSLSMSSLGGVIVVMVASKIASGSIAIFNLADNLQSLPFGMMVLPISITSFAYFTKYAAAKDSSGFTQHLKRSLWRTYFLLLPAIAAVWLVLPLAINIIFIHGKFSLANGQELLVLARILLFNLLFWGMNPLFNRAFFAWQETWKPFWTTLFSLGVNLGVLYLTLPHFGILALAIGQGAQAISSDLIMGYLLYRHFGSFFTWKKTAILMIVTGALAGFLYLLSLSPWDTWALTWQI